MDRDQLASWRTHMANERTLLAYVRTALAFIAAGAGMVHFLSSVLLQAVGWGILVSGGAIAVLGIVRFVAVRRQLSRLNR
jgi:putative membrane protein